MVQVGWDALGQLSTLYLQLEGSWSDTSGERMDDCYAPYASKFRLMFISMMRLEPQYW